MTDRAATRRVETMIAAEEIERARFRSRHGMAPGLRGSSTKSLSRWDPKDPDYSDDDDVVDKDGMVSFAGVEDDDVNVEELKRILNQGRRSAKAASRDGVTKAALGQDDTELLFDNILSSIGDRVGKKEVGAVEKLTAEVQSLHLLPAPCSLLPAP